MVVLCHAMASVVKLALISNRVIIFVCFITNQEYPIHVISKLACSSSNIIYLAICLLCDRK